MSKRDELMKYLSLTPWNTNPAILNEKIDEIVKEEGSGGEGSSDFSTAEVTFYNIGGAGSSYRIQLQIFDPQEESPFIKDEFYVEEEPVTKTVLLYKKKYFLEDGFLDHIDESYMPTTTGGFIIDFEKEKFCITGNGTFTAKGIIMD